jgi:hypothetical protein
MFFRHQKPQEPSFDERLSGLTQLKFNATRESPGRYKVTRRGCGAIIQDLGNGRVAIGKAGVLVGNEIASLVHGGYQMFLRTPSGKEIPALSSHLKELHSFDEDLREGLGLTSFYNQALGTTSDAHLYDRVEERDHAPASHPWEK